MKRNFAALVAGAALLAAAGAAQAQDRSTVRIATEGAYPPWNTVNAAGELEGFEIDLARDLCQRMDVECEIVAQEWDGIIPGLTTGKYDVIMAAMSITDERKQVISFAGPYVIEPGAFAAPGGSELLDVQAGLDHVNLNELSEEEQAALDALSEALDGKTVGVQVSTTYQNMAEEYLPDVELRTYDKVDSMALDMQSGRIDAMVADRSAVEAVIETQDGDVQIFGPNLSGGVFGAGIGAGIRQDDDELRAQFDQAITEATEDGTIERLSTEWFGYDASVKN